MMLSFSIFKFSLSQSHFSTFSEIFQFLIFILLIRALSFITHDISDDDNVIIKYLANVYSAPDNALAAFTRGFT